MAVWRISGNSSNVGETDFPSLGFWAHLTRVVLLELACLTLVKKLKRITIKIPTFIIPTFIIPKFWYFEWGIGILIGALVF